MTAKRSCRGPLLGSEGGAVALEFLLCLLPLVTVFFAICEICLLSTATMFVKHAAMSAVRASAVFRLPNPNELADVVPFDSNAYLPILGYEPKDEGSDTVCKNPKNATNKALCGRTYWNDQYDSKGDREKLVMLAATRALYPWYPSLLGRGNVTCTPDTLDAKTGANDDESCTVTSAYQCQLPITRALICPGGVRAITATASFTHQGAYYKPEFGW